MSEKTSIRFFNNTEVRAVWDNLNSAWRFAVPDIIGAMRNQPDYKKNRNYWKYLKNKLKKQNIQLVSDTNQLKITAPDGKKYLTDTLDINGIKELAKNFPGNIAGPFLDWLLAGEDTLDKASREKAHTLFESQILENLQPGTVFCLRQIHAYLFEGLYDFAGKIRNVNISKGGFKFANAMFLQNTLTTVEKMPENNFSEIIDKYVEMNIAHPFMEGNGRSMRIWLDLILKTRLKKCIDWSKVDKYEYLSAMKKSVSQPNKLKEILKPALTDKINDRETFMRGIDYSYYYEENR